MRVGDLWLGGHSDSTWGGDGFSQTMLYEASPGVFLVPEEGGFAEQLAVYI